MGPRTTVGQVTGLCLVLLILVGFASLSTTIVPVPGSSPIGQADLYSAAPVPTDFDCADLITPDTIGPEAFARYGLAEMLQSEGFVAEEFRGYIVCSHQRRPQREAADFQLHLDIYYMFDKGTGTLAVTRLEWEEPLREEGSSAPTAEPPAEVAGLDASAILTICMDAGTPLIEIAAENPEQWTVWDLLSSGQCAVEMTGPICWDCGEDPAWDWLVPQPEGQEPGASPGTESNGGKACLDAELAAYIGGQELDEEDAKLLSSGQCDLQLGGDQVCWFCSEAGPEPQPSPAPVEAEAAATTGEDGGAEPDCRDYVTPETVGEDEWQRYGVGEALRSGRLQRHLSPSTGRIVCYGDQYVDGILVGGSELYYMFDLESGQLLKKRIHWREDLPDHLPSPLISQQEAEAMVEGEVRGSELAVLSPGQEFLETDLPACWDPCWFVSTREGDSWPRVTVIDAMTGEVLGSFY